IEVAQKRVLIQGWAFASDGSDVSIWATIDGEKHIQGKWGLARFDVLESQKNEHAYESGFYIELKLPDKFDNKMHVQVFTGPDDTPVLLGEFSVTRTKSRKARKSKMDEANKHKFRFVPAGPIGSVRKTRMVFLDKIHSHGKLKPSDSVLEIGPGIGRFALPITQFLQPDGYFKGLEILPQAVKHCDYHIGSRYKNFEMFLVDVSNRMYNKSGKITAAEYRFPFESSEFDLVYLQSVFTHMMFPDVKNYISEISRVLKPGGRCIATYFLLNDDTRQLIDQGVSPRKFALKQDDSYSDNETKPEAAVAFEEELIRQIYGDLNLEIGEPIEYGSWRGIKSKMSQDILVAHKHLDDA
ncbi:MAG: class I SAM-dependent methyltransferase, partial [Gammaproteobacteria bacterium]